MEIGKPLREFIVEEPKPTRVEPNTPAPAEPNPRKQPEKVPEKVGV